MPHDTLAVSLAASIVHARTPDVLASHPQPASSPPPEDPEELVRKLGGALDGAYTLARTELRPGTLAGYERDLRIFRTWCRVRDVSALPAAPATVGAYLWSLFEHGRQKGGKFSAGTLSRRAAAIAFDHRRADLDDPTRGKVRSVLRSARSKIGVAPRFRRQALTVDMVDAMLAACPPTSLHNIRARALLCLGWSAALRRSELAALNVSDIETTAGGVFIHIRRSKTDGGGVGAVVGLPDRPHSHDRIRPVFELRRWLKRARLHDDDPVFQRINKADRVQGRLDAGHIGTIIKGMARAAGYDATLIGSHSMRRGFCTAAAHSGAGVAEMKAVTRHSSTDVLFGYVEDTNRIANYPRQILK